jgi:hypothetical protein
MIYLGYFICILFTLSVTSQTSPTCMYLSTTLPFLPTLASTSPPVHILLSYYIICGMSIYTTACMIDPKNVIITFSSP